MTDLWQPKGACSSPLLCQSCRCILARHRHETSLHEQQPTIWSHTFRFWFHSHVGWTFISKHHLLFIYSHIFSWCTCHSKYANDAFKYNSDFSWFVCRSPLITLIFVIEMNDAWNLKKQITCHCCTKNWSSIGSICIPQTSYCFLSCPQNIIKNHESLRANNKWLQNLSSLVTHLSCEGASISNVAIVTR